MPIRSVRYQKQLELRGDGSPTLPIEEGIEKVKAFANVKSDRSYKNGRKRKRFDQTMDLVLNLGIDPKQADQMLRGGLSLPKGTGRTRRVIAFCDETMVEAAKSAGAIEAGGAELIEKISKGWMDFDVAVSHPQMMGKVGKLGRILGPQGKMPSPKSGTVTQDVESAVREYAAGKVEYRNDAGGNIHLPVGKASFPTEDLKENIEAVVAHMMKIKPAAAKGTYIKRACLSATSTPAVMLEVG
ncbi:MAG: 50S ribosomal protein L1 [Planctomycetes bacterium]|nr:50S ribosomal protein L1 [Planctomycetota bacterium]